MSVLPISFFQRDVLEVAPQLLGKYLVRNMDGTFLRSVITEVEAYRGEEDLACHCSKGKTPRTQVMYAEGGKIYIYLIYGMYHMLNVVTGKENEPQAILIRGIQEISGPGRLTKSWQIDKSFNEKLLLPENNLWIEDNNLAVQYLSTPRIGLDYAKEWKDKPWRFVLK